MNFHTYYFCGDDKIPRKTEDETVFKVVATYTGKFKTLSAAKAYYTKLCNDPRFEISPIQEINGCYTFSAKYQLIAPSKQLCDASICAVKNSGACHISVTKIIKHRG